MFSKTKVSGVSGGGFAAAAGFAQTSVPQTAAFRDVAQAAAAGYLGVGVVDLTDERVKALKLKDDSGVEVKRVDENSPAAKAGFKENDVILEVNGKAIENIEQFQTTIGEMQPGTKVSLTIWRDGAKQTLSATLGFASRKLLPFGGPGPGECHRFRRCPRSRSRTAMVPGIPGQRSAGGI